MLHVAVSIKYLSVLHNMSSVGKELYFLTHNGMLLVNIIQQMIYIKNYHGKVLFTLLNIWFTIYNG